MSSFLELEGLVDWFFSLRGLFKFGHKFRDKTNFTLNFIISKLYYLAPSGHQLRVRPPQQQRRRGICPRSMLSTLASMPSPLPVASTRRPSYPGRLALADSTQ